MIPRVAWSSQGACTHAVVVNNDAAAWRRVCFWVLVQHATLHVSSRCLHVRVYQNTLLHRESFQGKIHRHGVKIASCHTMRIWSSARPICLTFMYFWAVYVLLGRGWTVHDQPKVCFSPDQCTYVPICLSICISFCLSVYLFIYLSIYLTAYVSIDRLIYVSICWSVSVHVIINKSASDTHEYNPTVRFEHEQFTPIIISDL